MRFWYFLLVLGMVSCSRHYQMGLELEAQGRWEESAIEYQNALIQDSEDTEIQQALKRVHLKVSEENMLRYQEYLEKQQFFKAFRRLEAAILQNPQHLKAQQEKKHWRKILLVGKIEFQFGALRRNIRLADQMKLQIKINSPTGKIIVAEIADENGIFFIEDLLYRKRTEEVAVYTIHSIGLKTQSKSELGFIRKEFEPFIIFRELQPLEIQGNFLKNNNSTQLALKTIELQKSTLNESLWFPPKLINYSLKIQQNKIHLLNTTRNEFAPQTIYQGKRHTLISFGSLKLVNASQGKWGIQRVVPQNEEQHPLILVSKNALFAPYFLYGEQYSFLR